jgi:hypothetical protein
VYAVSDGPVLSALQDWSREAIDHQTVRDVSYASGPGKGACRPEGSP